MASRPLFLALALLLFACSSSDDPTDSGPSGSGGGSATGCAATCSGCCDGETCLPLAVESALSCGKAGGKCASCGKGQTCLAGACAADPGVCSPATCAGGCCQGNICTKAHRWDSCGGDGMACQICAPGALCAQPGVCKNDQWGAGELLDLHLESVVVSEGQCSDPVGKPDPILVINDNGKTSSAQCSDSYSCALTLVVHSIPVGDFVAGKVLAVVTDADEVSNDPCWSAPIPVAGRDTGSKVLQSGAGSLTYHLTAAGQ